MEATLPQADSPRNWPPSPDGSFWVSWDAKQRRGYVDALAVSQLGGVALWFDTGEGWTLFTWDPAARAVSGWSP